MKKLIIMIMTLMLFLSGCVAVDSSESDKGETQGSIGNVGNDEEHAEAHIMTFVESKNVEIDNQRYIALFYDYTNNSGETAIPAEWIDVKAFQNGIELVVTVFTGEKTDGAVQCDTSIQDGTKARVVWLFERNDDSVVSVEMSDGQKFTVE